MRDSIVLRTFEPATASAEEWHAFHAFRRARATEDWPGVPPGPDHAAERDLRNRHPLWHWHSVLALSQSKVVGRLQLWWRREGSPGHERFAGHLMAGGGVLPDWRRRGIATRLARELLAFMQEHDMRFVSLRTPNPELAAGFLARLGARETYRDVDNRLRIADAPWAEIGRWARTPAGLRWEVHAGRVPMDRLRAVAPAIDAMLADVPRGGTNEPPLTFEPQAYEDLYRAMETRQGLHLLVVLQAGEQVAAVCEATWYGDAPATANQLFTGVARTWRGRGLGLAAKARMLQLLREQAPAAQEVLTNNAVDNAAMLRINARLGFQPLRQSAVFQLRREDLAQRLGVSENLAP